MPGALLTRPPARKIDWKLAAELRGQGLTYQQIQERTGAVSSESVRLGLMRRGVIVGVRTALLTRADQTAKQAASYQSQETRTNLSKAVLAQSEAITKIKAKPNLKSIKKFGDAIEPLVRSAERIHGWNSQSVRPLVNLNVLGSVQLDCGEMATTGSVPESCGVPETTQEPKPLTDKDQNQAV